MLAAAASAAEEPRSVAPAEPAPASEAIELSPFVVSYKGDEGYRAANTLSGTRMNASLFKTPAAISVMTKEFMDDLGMDNALDMLKFSMSSEHDRTADGLQQAFDVRPTIRGFADSVITRDYMPNMVQERGILASDRFNIERADLSRGANSVLYGASRSGGAFNLTSKRAVINGNNKTTSFTIGSWERKRSEMDLAIPLIKDTLALRANGMWEDKKGWTEFEMLRAKGLALSATYQPFQYTQIRVNMERMIREQVQASAFPHPDSGYTRWVMGGSPLAGNPLNPNPGAPPASPTPLLRSSTAVNPVYAPQIRDGVFRLATAGTGVDMRPDLPGVQGSGYWETIPGASAPAGGTVDDPFYGLVIPANANLSGPGRSSDLNYTIQSVFLEQQIGNLSIEVGFLSKDYRRGFSQPLAIAIGDPNPVLPGAYFADGDAASAVGRLPGTLLPDIGRVNPYAGGLYVQSQAQEQRFDMHDQHLRASAAYKFDFEKRHRWLGKHTLAAFVQQDKSLQSNSTVAEYNLAPNNNQPIDSAANTILRRTYLDFTSPDGIRGALDYRDNPIPVSPGMNAGFVLANGTPFVTKDNESAMIAVQSQFLDELLVITAGYRHDSSEVNAATSGGERLPNSTNLWLTQDYIFDSANIEKSSGPTRTFGAVLSPYRWLGLSFNSSQSRFPQGTNTNILGNPLEPIQGESKDYGLRFNLLKDRLYLNVNYYDNLGANQFQASLGTPRAQAVPALNAILNTQRLRGEALPPDLVAANRTLLVQGSSRETADYQGNGTEIEVTGTVYKGWSVSMNYSHNKISATNVAPDMNAFLARTQSLWDGNTSRLDQTPALVATFVSTRDNTPGRDFTLNPATYNDAYDYAVSVMDLVNQAYGQSPISHIESRFNIFNSYRFENDAWGFLKRARIGFGSNYRGPAVIGYDAANTNVPILGKSTILFNLMLGKRFPLGKGRSVDVQFNVENLFKQEDLLPYSATVPGNVVRYILPATRQSWNLRATYTF
jgi:iron complex outermembrane recepter protein